MKKKGKKMFKNTGKTTMFAMLIGFTPLLVATIVSTLHPSYPVTLLFVYVKHAVMIYLSISLIFILYKWYTKIDTKNIKQWLLFGMVALLGTAYLAATTISTTQLFYPTNKFIANESKEMEKGVIYVTYHDECEYCKASYKNMLKATTIYANTHFKSIRVVNLNKDTELAKQLTEKLDHYGSVAYLKDDGTLHEIAYTIGDKDGNPLPNSANDIYNRIEKVVSE
ncbi:MAG: hypothetical protein D8H99_64635 [Streptococcus sp.]|nr:MAG: hypothetical protein D8H99_64635 [Streptococcus sp.]